MSIKSLSFYFSVLLFPPFIFCSVPPVTWNARYNPRQDDAATLDDALKLLGAARVRRAHHARDGRVRWEAEAVGKKIVYLESNRQEDDVIAPSASASCSSEAESSKWPASTS